MPFKHTDISKYLRKPEDDDDDDDHHHIHANEKTKANTIITTNGQKK